MSEAIYVERAVGDQGAAAINALRNDFTIVQQNINAICPTVELRDVASHYLMLAFMCCKTSVEIQYPQVGKEVESPGQQTVPGMRVSAPGDEAPVEPTVGESDNSTTGATTAPTGESTSSTQTDFLSSEKESLTEKSVTPLTDGADAPVGESDAEISSAEPATPDSGKDTTGTVTNS